MLSCLQWLWLIFMLWSCKTKCLRDDYISPIWWPLMRRNMLITSDFWIFFNCNQESLAVCIKHKELWPRALCPVQIRKETIIECQPIMHWKRPLVNWRCYSKHWIRIRCIDTLLWPGIYVILMWFGQIYNFPIPVYHWVRCVITRNRLLFCLSGRLTSKCLHILLSVCFWICGVWSIAILVCYRSGI